jgi:hypothetical protein
MNHCTQTMVRAALALVALVAIADARDGVCCCTLAAAGTLSTQPTVHSARQR